MVIKAVQQFQLRTVLGTKKKAAETLRLMKEAGYEAIELNGFMIKKMPVVVRILTTMAGMPIGRGGKLNWEELVKESGLKVVSIHEDLGSILKRTTEVVEEANKFGTKYVVLTGMHHFDYSNKDQVLKLIDNLNEAGKLLEEEGISFLYHNHNCEFLKVEPGKTAYDLIIENTNPQYVNFEFDSYWAAEAGVDPLRLMDVLGERMKLYHINDRGTRAKGPASSILKSDSMELGYGNMDLKAMVEKAKNYGVQAIILESHRNWIEKSPVKSFQVSARFLNENV